MSSATDNFLEHRAALITGGGKRIGSALVRALAGHGAAVVIHHHTSADEATALVQEINAAGGQAVTVSGDLADGEAAAGLVGVAAHALGKPLDLLVNNASIFEPGGLGVDGGQLWDRHEAINLRAPFLLARSFARQLLPGSQGDILHLNDIRALRPGTDYLAYTASKIGLHGLTRSLAQELAPQVRVNEIALGAVLPPDKPAGEYSHVRREDILLQAFPTVEQVTDTLLFLLRNQAVTGQTLCIDGGQHLR